MVKTFTYDVRGFRYGLASLIDNEINAWIAAETPASIDNMDMASGNETLVIIISYTA